MLVLKKDGCSQKRLNQLQSKISSVPVGQELLALAQHRGCDVVLDQSLPDETMGLYESSGADGKSKILLNPRCDDIDLLRAFAHELRHMWQNHVLKNIFNPYVTPRSLIIYDRVIEGDAFTFDTYFNMCMKKSPLANNLDWRHTFNLFQKSELANFYDLETIPILEDLLRADKNTVAKGGKSDLKEAFNLASDSELLRLRCILRKGLTQDAPYYASETVFEDVANTIRPDVLCKIKNLELRINAL